MLRVSPLQRAWPVGANPSYTTLSSRGPGGIASVAGRRVRLPRKPRGPRLPSAAAPLAVPDSHLTQSSSSLTRRTCCLPPRGRSVAAPRAGAYLSRVCDETEQATPHQPTMPTYEYRCAACGAEFEKFGRMSDPPREPCPACGAEAQRKLSAGAGLLFKGSGFYITDYRGDSYKKAAASESGGGEAKAEPKGDAKPAPKSETKPTPPPASGGGAKSE